MLRNYVQTADKEQSRTLLKLLSNKAVRSDQQKATWLTTHEVMQDLLATPITDWLFYGDLFARLRGDIARYVIFADTDAPQKQARATVIDFLSRLCLQSPLFSAYLDGLIKQFSDTMLLGSSSTHPQRVPRLATTIHNRQYTLSRPQRVQRLTRGARHPAGKRLG